MCKISNSFEIANIDFLTLKIDLPAGFYLGTKLCLMLKGIYTCLGSSFCQVEKIKDFKTQIIFVVFPGFE